MSSILGNAYSLCFKGNLGDDFFIDIEEEEKRILVKKRENMINYLNCKMNSSQLSPNTYTFVMIILKNLQTLQK